ncbi:hypothetical protein [Streptomyces aureocirculatus]|uniref:hypothetical protein n=1 Tax=Streptomyces aureocirculatus TaxID=67275 RepID=UPI0004C4BA9B|nr:hypothetical protein [Streptomyces aureocirculatus]
MAALVQEQHLEVFVDDFVFTFQESRDAELDLEFPDGIDADVFLNAFPGRVDVSSAGHIHTVVVSAQVWDGPPPVEDPSAWDVRDEAPFESVSGDVAVWTPTMGRTDDLIALGQQGAWRVRVHCAGRAEAAALRDSAEAVVGVERFLVQFFPN